MSALESLHEQLKEVLRTEAVATVAAYEAGQYICVSQFAVLCTSA